MFCSKCGTRLTEGMSFCSSCGQPVVALPTTPSGVPATYSSPVVAPAGGVPVYSSAPIAVALPSPYAGFWLRVVAHLIDGLVIGVVFGILCLIGIAFVGMGALRAAIEGLDNPDAGLPVAIIGMFIFVGIAAVFASWIYFAYMESSPNQGTLGKMALGLIVTDLEGRRISFGRATGRYFAKVITGMIPFGIGYMMAGFTEKKQALHDMIVGTLVLRKT
jgi:uncharacterized RDD family membrane protein YckC